MESQAQEQVLPHNQESSTPSSRSSLSHEVFVRQLRSWGIAQDAIDGAAHYADQARSLSAGMEADKRGVFLSGLQGRGKTSLAAAILRVELERFYGHVSPYRTIRFVYVPDLLLEMQGSFRPEAKRGVDEIVADLSDVDFLVLDGMGEGGRPSDFVIGNMGTLIHHRDADRCERRTVMTSNYSLQELAERLDARIASRCASMCHVVPFTGPDRRINR